MTVLIDGASMVSNGGHPAGRAAMNRIQRRRCFDELLFHKLAGEQRLNFLNGGGGSASAGGMILLPLTLTPHKINGNYKIFIPYLTRVEVGICTP